MTRSIECVVVNDWYGGAGFGSDEEAAHDAARLQGTLGRVVHLAGAGRSLYGFRDWAIDLLVLDYGGMGPGAEATVHAQIDYALHWAEDHPNTLLLIYTEFTAMEYGPELKDTFGHVPNIVPFYAKSDEEQEGLRSWFPETIFTPWKSVLDEPHDHLVAPRRRGPN